MLNLFSNDRLVDKAGHVNMHTVLTASSGSTIEPSGRAGTVLSIHHNGARLNILGEPVNHALPVLVEGPETLVFEKGEMLVLELLQDLQ